MRRISNSVEHNNSLEQVTNKLGKSVRLISLGTGRRESQETLRKLHI